MKLNSTIVYKPTNLQILLLVYHVNTKFIDNAVKHDFILYTLQSVPKNKTKIDVSLHPRQKKRQKRIHNSCGNYRTQADTITNLLLHGKQSYLESATYKDK